MKTLTFLVLALLAAPAVGALQWMDAAELDRHGQPLDFAGCRGYIDNRQGVADLTNVRYKLDWTGTATGIPSYTWEDPRNPWYGASNHTWLQPLNGLWYLAGDIYYPPSREWAPNFEVWSDPEGLGPKWWIDDTVPAGLVWDRCFFVEGVTLFHSPASGQASYDGQTYTLYDDDPMPQTVPGPGALVILAIGAVFSLRRRR